MIYVIKKGDTAPTFEATLSLASGAAATLTAATVAFVYLSLNSSTAVTKAMTIANATTGVVQYDFLAGETDVVATYKYRIRVTYSDETIQSFPGSGWGEFEIQDGLS